MRTVAPYTVGQQDAVTAGSMIFFLPRLNAPAAVSPGIAAWGVEGSYFARARMSGDRIVGDTLDVIQALATADAVDDSVIERQYVSDELPEGIDFTGAVAWLIGRNATAVGTVRPWMALRVFDRYGAALRATLLALGEHGTGTNCNSNGTRLWAGNTTGGPALASYVSQLGDRLVLDIGYNVTGAGGASAVYGSRSATVGSEFAMHVASTAAEGINPGNRASYLEIIGATLP